MTDLRPYLRGLPVFAGDLPTFDPSAAPDQPSTLFAAWLTAAAGAGEREPHAMTLSTIGADGVLADDPGYVVPEWTLYTLTADQVGSGRATKTANTPGSGTSAARTAGTGICSGPDPACVALGAAPARSVAVEDSRTGVAPARAAGLHVVGVPSSPGTDLAADTLLESLTDPALTRWAAATRA